jgi:putative transposase
VLAVLTSERFVDKSVAQTWATLLDEGTYLCSMSTMHRILRAHAGSAERRAQATHPPRARPEPLATKPGQVWSCYAGALVMPSMPGSRAVDGVGWSA